MLCEVEGLNRTVREKCGRSVGSLSPCSSPRVKGNTPKVRGKVERGSRCGTVAPDYITFVR
jgi:hypothetical protein